MKRLVVYIIGFLSIFSGVNAQTPNLSLSDQNSDGLIPLFWDNISTWDSATIFKRYVHPDSSFKKLVAIPNSQYNYQDTADCELSLEYYLDFYIDDTTISSNTKSIDETDPFPPSPYVLILDSISVNTSGRLEMGWQKSEDATCEGYIVFNTTLDTLVNIKDPEQTHLLLPDTLKPEENQYGFLVIAYDNCNSSIPIDSTNLQSTVFMEKPVYNICDQEVNINFSEYRTNKIDTINQQVEKYHLIRKDISTNTSRVVGTSNTANSFTDQVEPNKTYEYFIRAKLTSDYSEPATSSSARKTITTSQIPQPDQPSIASASVVGRSIELNGIVDSTGFVQGYKLMRHSENEENFERVLDTISTQTSTWELTDETALPSDKSYFYKLVTIDSCGNDTTESNITRTIHLEINSPDNNTNELSWNHYEGWEADYDYLVYRYENSGQPEPDNKITEVGNNQNNYSDNNFSTLPAGQWYYRVKALKDGDNGKPSDSAWSNEVMGNQEAKLEMPNAFRPGGTNYEFKPRSANLEGYSLKIFNRWGALLFESTEPETGWEGRYKGENAPAGTYVYILQYKDQNDNLIQKKGTVTLIR